MFTVSKTHLRKCAALVALMAATIPTSAPATSYKFTVVCENGSKVVEWRTGTIDPGREALRVSTGTSNPSCSVSHYNPSNDNNLPVEVRDGPVAVIQGIPFVGEIAKAILGGL